MKWKLQKAKLGVTKYMDLEQGKSDFIAFCDECGDHSMDKIDSKFPLFVLSIAVVKRNDYSNVIVPQISQLKLRYWDHEGVNLHSSEIRKAEGPFSFLQNPFLRETFVRELSKLMMDFPYTLFLVVIKKDAHQEKYGKRAFNPYSLSLTFAMERIVHFMEIHNQDRLPIIVESRGKREDNELKAAFFDLITNGTRYMTEGKFRNFKFPLLFHDKRRNITGLQLADLCAHPTARHILKPDQPNKAFEVVKKHIYKNQFGLKVFP